MRNTYIGGTSVEPRRSVWLGVRLSKEEARRKVNLMPNGHA